MNISALTPITSIPSVSELALAPVELAGAAATSFASQIVQASAQVAQAAPLTAIEGVSGLTTNVALAVPEPAIADKAASVVELSTLAQLLEATQVFQTQTSQLDPSEASEPVSSLSTTMSSDFGKLLSSAQVFVNAYNNFQTTSADTLASPLGLAFDNALLLALHAQSGASDGSSVIDSLAQIGINFQEASGSGGSGTFTIDLKALQAAFDLNPLQTAELLAQNLQALATIEAQLLSQPSGLGLDLFASGMSVPASQFDAASVNAQLAGLKPSDAQLVNIALKKMMADEALLEGLGDTAITSSENNVTNTPISAVENSPGNAATAVEAATTTQVTSVPANIEVNTEASIESGIKAATATFYASQPALSSETSSGVLNNSVASIAASPASNSPAQPVNVGQAAPSVWSSGLTESSAPVNMGGAEWAGSTIAKSSVEPWVYAPPYVSSNVAKAAAGAVADPSSGQLRSGILAAGQNESFLMSNGAATNAGVATVATSATPAVLTSLAPAFGQLNPYLSAAVAAYRVNDAVASKPSYEFVDRGSETVPGVSTVPKNRAMNLDLHNGSNGSRNQQTSRSAVRTGARNESDLNATAPLVTGLDVSA
jgi:hypothetical protein